MAIRYQADSNTFILETKDCSYLMKVSRYGNLLHLYYGKRIPDSDVDSCFSSRTGASPPIPMKRGMTAPSPWTSFSRSFPPTERATTGVPALRSLRDGSAIFSGKVVDYRIYKGKYRIEECLLCGRRIRIGPIPWKSAWRTGKAVRPLPLLYGVFEEKNIITRSVRFENGGNQLLNLNRLMSATVDYRIRNMIWFIFRDAI